MLLFTLLLSVVLLVLTDLSEARLIVDGSTAYIRKHPYQVSLRFNGYHFCGGSIYKSNIIITAAHCVSNSNIEDLSIAAGYTLLSEAHDFVKVKKFIVHENYDSFVTHGYDIAILVLDRHLRFNSKVQPIRLATERKPSGTPVTVSGWGFTEEEGSNSNYLQQVEVEIVSNEECQELFSGMYEITKSMLCAGVEEGGKDACTNDSGGPLVFEEELIGVVSWGEGCGIKGFPGVYVSVPDLHEWIEKTVKENDDSSV